MLSKPIAGWVNITVGEQVVCASYLTDVPLDLLESFITTLSYYGRPTVVSFDEEGSYAYLILDYNNALMVVSRDINTVSQEPQCMVALALELISDIREYIDEWTIWNPARDDTPPKGRKEILLARCAKIERLLKGIDK